MLEELPIELARTVLDYLDTQSLATAALVSKGWYHEIRKYIGWRDRILYEFAVPPLLPEKHKKHQHRGSVEEGEGGEKGTPESSATGSIQTYSNTRSYQCMLQAARSIDEAASWYSVYSLLKRRELRWQNRITRGCPTSTTTADAAAVDTADTGAVTGGELVVGDASSKETCACCTIDAAEHTLLEHAPNELLGEVRSMVYLSEPLNLVLCGYQYGAIRGYIPQPSSHIRSNIQQYTLPSLHDDAVVSLVQQEGQASHDTLLISASWDRVIGIWSSDGCGRDLNRWRLLRVIRVADHISEVALPYQLHSTTTTIGGSSSSSSSSSSSGSSGIAVATYQRGICYYHQPWVAIEDIPDSTVRQAWTDAEEHGRASPVSWSGQHGSLGQRQCLLYMNRNKVILSGCSRGITLTDSECGVTFPEGQYTRRMYGLRCMARLSEDVALVSGQIRRQEGREESDRVSPGYAVAVWDIRSADPVTTVVGQGRHQQIRTLSLSPLEPWIVAGGSVCVPRGRSGVRHKPVIKLWDLRMPTRCIGTLYGHECPAEYSYTGVDAVAFTPTSLWSGGGDGTVRVWNDTPY